MIQSTYQGGGTVPWSEWSYFQLQTTTNLASPNWVPLDYVLTITNGNLIFIEHSVTNSRQRFYRIMMR